MFSPGSLWFVKLSGLVFKNKSVSGRSASFCNISIADDKSLQQTVKHEAPVSYDCCDDTSDGVGEDGFWCEIAEAHGVKHCCVGAEVAAPAHSDCCEYCDGVTVNPAGLHEVRNKS